MNNTNEKGLFADPSLNMKIAQAIKEYFRVKFATVDIDIKYFIDYEDEDFQVSCMVYRFDDVKKRMVYEIYIPSSELIPEEYIEVHKVRISEFLEGLGVEESTTTLSICHILHEFGHIDYMNTMNVQDCWKEMQFVTDTVDSYTNIAFSRGCIEAIREEGIDVVYWLRPQEMFADAFMYKNFLPIFKHLQEKGLIDNE